MLHDFHICLRKSNTHITSLSMQSYLVNLRAPLQNLELQKSQRGLSTTIPENFGDDETEDRPS